MAAFSTPLSSASLHKTVFKHDIFFPLLMRFRLFPFCFLPIRLSESLSLSDMNLCDPADRPSYGDTTESVSGCCTHFPMCTPSDLRGHRCRTDTYTENIYSIRFSKAQKSNVIVTENEVEVKLAPGVYFIYPQRLCPGN